jgi:hypothetical protein
MKYKIKQIVGGIFVSEFENNYDLAMTFLRYQEFYESANPKFKGKHFTIIDFMEWYSRENGNGVFTYPNDWAGFNIPVNIISKVQSKNLSHNYIPDWNKYDDVMLDILIPIETTRGIGQEQGSYLIGIVKGSKSVMRHEIAHGLYHVYSDYKTGMNKLYSNLSVASKNLLNSKFKAMGYHKSVWKDEAQAYLSTGEYLTAAERKPFVELLKYYDKNLSWK